MKKVLAFALALSMLLAALPAFAAEEVNVFNWVDFICEDAINLFEAETGIKVNYMRFTTNEDMLVQVENDPKSYDVIFPSDYIIERLIAEDLLEKLDYSQLPNATENTLDWLKTADYDPTGEYSVPYMWGTVGILYNKTMVSAPITSWTAMWDEQYYDNVFMMDSIRDTLGVTLKMLGYSMNTRDKDALNQAKEKLIEQKKLNKTYWQTGDEFSKLFAAGQVQVGLMWSGQSATMKNEGEPIGYVVPEDGAIGWVDNWGIPANSQNKDLAYKFIDFMLSKDVQYDWAANKGGPSPANQSAAEAIDPEYAAACGMDEESLNRLQFMKYRTDEVKQAWNELWTEVKAS